MNATSTRIAFGLVLLFGSEPADAHAMLEAAVPPAGSIVRAAPTSLTLTFSEALEPRFSKILVTAADGTRVDKDDLHTAPGNAKKLILDMRDLPPGHYKVVWRAVSIDAHKTQGSYGFTVAS
jgi:methionine-rich copper-binding protein CopC